MSEDPKKLEETIYRLNGELYNQTEESTAGTPFEPLAFSSSGDCQIVTVFEGVVLWNSEEDEREYDEDRDAHEDLETFLRQRIQDFVDTVKLIKMI